MTGVTFPKTEGKARRAKVIGKLFWIIGSYENRVLSGVMLWLLAVDSGRPSHFG